MVSAEPIIPAIWHTMMLKIRRKMSFLSIIYLPSREVASIFQHLGFCVLSG
jgi:hypothetical protein